MSVLACSYRIEGRVQGVGFRYFVRRAAQELGVVGWVRNRSDGSVEALAWAAEDVLGEFLKRLKAGPRWSHVDSVTVAAYAGDPPDRGGFEVKPTV